MTKIATPSTAALPGADKTPNGSTPAIGVGWPSMRHVRWTLLVLSLVMIYFEVYWQYWFVRLLNGYVVSTLAPVAVLGLILVVDSFRHMRRGDDRVPGLHVLALPICFVALYLAVAVCSVFINEQSFREIRRWLIYLVSPITIFVIVVGLLRQHSVDTLIRVLRVLTVTAVLLSIYAVTVYYYRGGTLLDGMPPVAMSNGGVMIAYASSGSSQGTYYLRRLALPGMSSTTYGPMLVPLLLFSMSLGRRASRRVAGVAGLGVALFLAISVFLTLSRGAMLALTAGIGYLLWHRVIRVWEILLPIVLVGLAFPKSTWAIFIRFLVVFVPFLPADTAWHVEQWAGLGGELGTDDPHLTMMLETFGHMLEHPVFGLGMSNLITQEAHTLGKDHNNYLSIGASFGAVALWFYVMFIGLLFRTMHRTLKRYRQETQLRNAGIGLGAGMLALIVFLNSAPTEFHFIWVWFGFIAAWIIRVNADLDAAATPSEHG